jgi:predicted alpha/beta hydrolase family esterase
MQKKFRIVFIHGYTASHLADWYPSISPMLTDAGIEFAVPDLPGGQRPHALEWLEVIHREVRKSPVPVVLVGHSLGSRAALLYLEKYPIQPKAVFLIAAFANRPENAKRKDGEAYPDFFTHTIDTGKLRREPTKYAVIHSTDDDSILFAQGQEIAKDLGANLYTLHGRGHLYDPSDAKIIFDILISELKL